MAPILRLEDVHKHFGGLRAVDGVTAEVADGELVGLIGPNGSGKSTLFNVISGVYRPDGGTITFRGDRIDGLEPWEIFSRGVVRSFQNPRLFRGMTVVENALLPARDQKGERLVNAPFPGRWKDQEKRLAEDATAGVAPKLAGEIFEEIAALRREHGLTFLIIEHRLEVLLGAVERVLVLHQGRVLFDGKPDEAVADPAVADAYLGE